MSLPEPILDDLRFQKDLVDEARRRIIRYCPEWTEYNLSDPGITLIELFAWMTEMLTYRLNRVPEKNYLKFMELLGIQLQPATSARTDLTVWLSTPLPLAPEDDTVAVVPAGTEVATRRMEAEPEVTFTTDQRLVIRPPRLVQLRRDDDFNKNYLPRLGIETVYMFNRQQPQIGDTFYFGFADTDDLAGHLLQLRFLCEETQATGIRRENPPLVWEGSLGGNQWRELTPSTRPGEKDTTGGLNNPEGQLVLYLPLTLRPDVVHSKQAYWVRCRLEPREKDQGMYTQSPRLKNVQAFTLGGTTPATHALTVRAEKLGVSNGEPGQVFYLANHPLLALQAGETVEVEEKVEGEIQFVPWTCAPDFSVSDRHTRHFTLDTATGEVRFGPCIRQADGTMRQYGRLPEAERTLRFSQYRWGGGNAGNVPAGKIQVLKTSLPYVDRVSNLYRAEGGRDPEDLAEAKLRAQREVHAQQRAVTAEDYESLARKASRSVARVKCMTAGADQVPPGMVELLVVPAVANSVQIGDLGKLALSLELQKQVTTYLDDYRLLTTTLRLRAPRYLGIKVVAEIVIAPNQVPERVQSQVQAALQQFLTPLAPPSGYEALADLVGDNWEGWPFGRDLYLSELYALIQKVRGVRHVREVRFSYRPVAPADEKPSEAESSAPGALTSVEKRLLEVPADTLLCSLAHEVHLVEL